MKIEGIITSYNRHDLLYQTLRSIKEFMSDEISTLYVVEDSEHTDSFLSVCSEFSEFVQPLPLDMHTGHVYAIDHAMQKITTKYYFHGEDDFQCIKSGFTSFTGLLEYGNGVLEVNGRGRDRKAVNHHPINSEGMLSTDYHGWTGKMWSPCICRLSEYKKLGRYSDHITFEPSRPFMAEKEIGKKMMKEFNGCYVTESPYFEHIGDNRSTSKFIKQ